MGLKANTDEDFRRGAARCAHHNQDSDRYAGDKLKAHGSKLIANGYSEQPNRR